jgi:acyl-CoA synthetase (AMP-forming)/AMP-acid ligase II
MEINCNAHRYHTINDILVYQKLNNPKAIAYRFLINDKESETISNEELYQRVLSLASMIQQYAKPMDRIIIAARPGFDFIIGFYACLLTRTIAIPIFPPANNKMTSRFLHVINNAKPKLILCDHQTSKAMYKAQKANLFIPGKLKRLFGLYEVLSQLLTMIKKERLEIINIDKSKNATFNALNFLVVPVRMLLSCNILLALLLNQKE